MNNHLYRAPQCTGERKKEIERKKIGMNTQAYHNIILLHVHVHVRT